MASQAKIIEKLLDVDEITGVFGFSNKSNFVQQAVAREIQRIENWRLERNSSFQDNKNKKSKKEKKNEKIPHKEPQIHKNQNDDEKSRNKRHITEEKDDIAIKSIQINAKNSIKNQLDELNTIEKIEKIYDFQGYQLKNPDFTVISELFKTATDNLRAKIKDTKESKSESSVDNLLIESVEFKPISIQLRVNNFHINEIYANNCYLKEFPDSIIKLQHLKKIDLSNNEIKNINLEFISQKLSETNIEEINLKDNPIKKVHLEELSKILRKM